METLKPCPFCGENAVLEDHNDNGWFVGCDNAYCAFRPNSWEDTKDDAIVKWNFRKE